MKNKKLFIINTLTLFVFIIVVIIGSQTMSQGEYELHDNQQVDYFIDENDHNPEAEVSDQNGEKDLVYNYTDSIDPTLQSEDAPEIINNQDEQNEVEIELENERDPRQSSRETNQPITTEDRSTETNEQESSTNDEDRAEMDLTNTGTEGDDEEVSNGEKPEKKPGEESEDGNRKDDGKKDEEEEEKEDEEGEEDDEEDVEKDQDEN